MHAPAPMFDDLHALSSPIPLAPCTDERMFLALVAELGDPRLVDERVVPMPPAPAGVVAGDVVEGPPTAALTLVPTQAMDLPGDCEDCPALPGEPCRTPSGRKRLSNHAGRGRSAASA